MRKVSLAIFLFLTAVCYAENVPRIISLAPNTTEILFCLGLGDYIVGVDDFSNYPQAANNIERLGTFSDPNMERIMLLKPDYVLVSSGLGKAREDHLVSLGIKILKVSPKNMQELYADIRKIGAVFHKEKEAGGVIEDMQARISRFSGIKEASHPPKVFVQLFDDPLVTVSSFISDIIRLAGGENIAQDVKDDAGIFSYEALIARNPDIILAVGFSGGGNFSRVIKAVKNNRIYKDLNPDLILRPGPRAAEAVETLHRIFYE